MRSYFISVCLICILMNKALCSTWINTSREFSEGRWDKPQKCAQNTFAIGFQLVIESNRGWLDDSSINQIRLICQDTSIIQSPMGQRDLRGYAAEKHICNQGYLIAFRLRVDFDSYDNAGACNLDMQCSDKNILNANGHNFGRWDKWHECPAGNGIVGIQAKLHNPIIYRDQCGMVNVNFECEPYVRSHYDKFISSIPEFEIGDWHPVRTCSNSLPAIGFQLHIEDKNRGDNPYVVRDGTSLNIIKLICQNSERIESPKHVEWSDTYGYYRDEHYCNHGDYLIGFRLKQVPWFSDLNSQGAVDIDFKCSNGAEIKGNGLDSVHATWQSWQSCENGYIVGLQSQFNTRVYKIAFDNDYTGLVNVKFQCHNKKEQTFNENADEDEYDAANEFISDEIYDYDEESDDNSSQLEIPSNILLLCSIILIKLVNSHLI